MRVKFCSKINKYVLRHFGFLLVPESSLMKAVEECYELERQNEDLRHYIKESEKAWTADTDKITQ